jgi:cytochrome c-type biogenesis protein CcmH
MTQFWIIAAGLIVLAMAFVALPLMRSRYKTGINADELNLSVFKQQLAELDSDLEAGILDQDRYDAAKRDLEKELLSDIQGEPSDISVAPAKGSRWMALSALLIPLVALFIYQILGSPELIQRLAEQPSGGATNTAHAQQQGADTKNLPPMEELVRRLAAKLEEQPNNPQGWVMLGRSYVAMNDYPKALQAYERAIKLDGENVNTLLAYAEAIAGSNGNNFTGNAAPLVDKAFSLEPQNPNVLWISGILAYQQGDFRSALTRWEKVQGMLTPQSSELVSVTSAIDDARKQLGLPPSEPELPQIAQAGAVSNNQMPPGSATPASSSPAGVEVKVSLSAEMAQKAKPDDLVFIYAKAVSGPPMPLAAARKQVHDLPLTIRLDDSMAMMPQMKISKFEQVVVGARISLSGNPMAQSGDLEGEVRPVTPGQSETVNVVINSVHP